MASFLTSWFSKKAQVPQGTKSPEAFFQEVMEQHGAALLRVAGVYGFSGADREELEQEIAVAIWEAVPRWNSTASLKTYLFRVAHNTCIDRMRAGRPVLEGNPDEAIASNSSPENQLINREALRHLQIALQKLPLLQRQAITMSMEGLLPDEIAEVLGATPNYVHVLIHRARTTLRKEIEG